ncbi:MAG: S26 family signal peptidase [Halobacteriaceae archaeon]
MPSDGDRPEHPQPRSPNDDGAGGDGAPDPRDGVVPAARWILTTEYGPVAFGREMAGSVLAVLLVGLLLFAISGVWPPMVAVESGSMEPNMYRGDLVFLMEEHRLAPAAAYGDTGVVTARDGAAVGYYTFGGPGDVIIYSSPTNGATPIIHRARFWVDGGENWFPRVNESYVPRGVSSCADLRYCPAPHGGFVTKGDANEYYDQANGISPPVRPSWIRGTAELRVPWLGHVRLFLAEAVASGPRVPAR